MCGIQHQECGMQHQEYPQWIIMKERFWLLERQRFTVALRSGAITQNYMEVIFAAYRYWLFLDGLLIGWFFFISQSIIGGHVNGLHYPT